MDARTACGDCPRNPSAQTCPTAVLPSWQRLFEIPRPECCDLFSIAYDAPMTRESHGSPAAGEPTPPSTLINGHDRHRRKTRAVGERLRQPTMDPDRQRKTQTANDGPRPSAKDTDPQRWPQFAAFTHSTGAAASRMTFWIVDPSRNLPTGVRFLVPSTISSAPTSVAVSRICSAGSYSLPSVSTRNSTPDLLR